MAIQLLDSLRDVSGKIREALEYDGAGGFDCGHINPEENPKAMLLLMQGAKGKYKIMLCQDCARRQKNGEEMLTPEEVATGKKIEFIRPDRAAIVRGPNDDE
jgi:hypothetical protein